MFEDDKGVIRCYPRRTDNTKEKEKTNSGGQTTTHKNKYCVMRIPLNPVSEFMSP